MRDAAISNDAAKRIFHHACLVASQLAAVTCGRQARIVHHVPRYWPLAVNKSARFDRDTRAAKYCLPVDMMAAMHGAEARIFHHAVALSGELISQVEFTQE